MRDRDKKAYVGVDLGGSKILAARIEGKALTSKLKMDVPRNGSKEEVLFVLCQCIDGVLNDTVEGIGVGVPSVVDVERGIVYDVQNIKSWDEVQLGEILSDKYQIPIKINNDANCFALGERFFGKGEMYKSSAAVIIGTGMAAGLILNGKLYEGANCGAGEFGMLPYLENNYEYYASGQFFENQYKRSGLAIYEDAEAGDQEAKEILDIYGYHLGNALKAVLYTLDPEIIILGGSVSKAYEYFEQSMKKQMSTLAYGIIAQKIKIEVSTNPDIAVLGAAALLLD